MSKFCHRESVSRTKVSKSNNTDLHEESLSIGALELSFRNTFGAGRVYLY